MRWFFFENYKIFQLLLISLIFCKFLPISIFLSWLLCVFTFLFLFRKQNVSFNQHIEDEGTFLSPVSGKVVGVYENKFEENLGTCTQIGLDIPYFSTYGIYLPTSSRVNLVIDGEIEKKLIFDSINKGSYIFKLCSRASFIKSRLWVRPGDLGKIGSCIGFLPFGGSVFLTIPANDDILVKVGDKVVANQTIISTQKGLA